MALIDITGFDPTPYQTTPLLPAESTATLGADLFALKPADAPLHVEKAAKRMLNTVNEMREVFVSRVELAGISLRTLMLFDSASDRFWVATRQRCSYWMIYAHEGLDLLSEEEQASIQLTDKREMAELARELDKHLFGIDGLKFLSKPFNQQVTLMGSRLTFITISNKVSLYEQLLGPDLLNTLNVLQGRYEAMVRDRSARDDDVAGLRLLRFKLQRHIALYANAVLTMLDEDEDESIDLVRAALRPMINARLGKSSSSDKSEDTSEPETEGEPLPVDMLEDVPAPEPENGDGE